MPGRIFLYGLAALALISIACGINFQIPVDRVVTGQTVSQDINIPAPAGEAELELSFGAGEFDLQGGAPGSALVVGAVTYNVEDFKPEITTQGDRISIKSGDLELNGIPNLDEEIVNHWDLRLGTTPMDLTISAGAFEGDIDLGGVLLKSLEVSGGASDVRLDFSTPNPIEMDTLLYTTGASNVRLTGLANANFETMIFRSGLGNFTLDFAGDLSRDADVTIESGVSKVTIIVPEQTRARLVVTGGLNNVVETGRWQKSGGEYLLGSGSGPLLTLHINMSAGELELRAN